VEINKMFFPLTDLRTKGKAAAQHKEIGEHNAFTNAVVKTGGIYFYF
jgi:hypothetical protein